MEKTEKIKNKEYRIQMRGIDQIMENGEVSSALQVLRIPATKQGSEMKKEKKRIRVAAYCRVSTGDESQQTSYSSQKIFYIRLIHSKADW